MNTLFKTLFISILLASCQHSQKSSSEDTEAAKQEILDAEKSFDAMAQNSGVKEAFLAFAANNATILRGNQAITGIDSIRAYLSKPSPYHDVKLTWKPEYVDVASSCDLGHTWGFYTFTAKDSLENAVESKGIFRTVWRKQPDGNWKFVLD